MPDVGCRCACACSCSCNGFAPTASSSPAPASHPLPPSSSSQLSRAAQFVPHSTPRKQWLSYDETDADSQYGFQRKRRFGGKNSSSAVAGCLSWKDNEESEAAEQAQAEGQRRPIQIKIGERQTHQHTCQCTNAHELLQLKHAMLEQQREMKRQEEALQKLARGPTRLPPKKHVCGCGCVSEGCSEGCQACGRMRQQQQQQSTQQQLAPGAAPAQAWQMQPQNQQQQQQFQHQFQQQQPQQSFQQPQQQQQQLDDQQASALMQTEEPDVQSYPESSPPTHRTPPKQKQQKPLKQKAKQQPQQPPSSARPSARDRVTRRDLSQLVGGEDTSLPATARRSAPSTARAGLGNTLKGSPHDPRQLHDPSSIDPVWRKRQQAKQRALRQQALMGYDPLTDRNTVDEKAYAASMEKQQARRIKIQQFEARHTEDRLNKSMKDLQQGFTREWSESFMATVTGRPPFCAFGNGNIAPAAGGIIYGDYMVSHNVSPERPPNRPRTKQIYEDTRQAAQRKKKEDAQSRKRMQQQMQQEMQEQQQQQPQPQQHTLQQGDRPLLWSGAQAPTHFRYESTGSQPSSARRPAPVDSSFPASHGQSTSSRPAAADSVASLMLQPDAASAHFDGRQALEDTTARPVSALPQPQRQTRQAC